MEKVATRLSDRAKVPRMPTCLREVVWGERQTLRAAARREGQEARLRIRSARPELLAPTARRAEPALPVAPVEAGAALMRVDTAVPGSVARISPVTATLEIPPAAAEVEAGHRNIMAPGPEAEVPTGE